MIPLTRLLLVRRIEEGWDTASAAPSGETLRFQAFGSYLTGLMGSSKVVSVPVAVL